jgi:hypothetical protein
MEAFSGFYENHGPPPSGDVCGIVPAHRHGHQNGPQSGHICIVICIVDSFAVALVAAEAMWSE